MLIPSRSDLWTTLFGHTSGLARISKFCLDQPSGIPKKFDHFVRTTSGKCHFLLQNLFGWTTGLPTYIWGSCTTLLVIYKFTQITAVSYLRQPTDNDKSSDLQLTMRLIKISAAVVRFQTQVRTRTWTDGTQVRRTRHSVWGSK